MKTLAILALAMVTTSALAACHRKNEWPPESTRAFLTMCVMGRRQQGFSAERASAFCDCSLDATQRLYSVDEMAKIEGKMLGNNFQSPPPELVKIQEQCALEHPEK